MNEFFKTEMTRRSVLGIAASGLVLGGGQDSNGAEADDVPILKLDIAKSSIVEKKGNRPNRSKMEALASHAVDLSTLATSGVKELNTFFWEPIHHGGCDLKDIVIRFYSDGKVTFYANGKSREKHGDSWELRFTITAPGLTWISPNSATTALNEHFTIPISDQWKGIPIDLSAATFQKFPVDKILQVNKCTIDHYC